MSARIFFPKRVPFSGLAAGKRTPAFARFNSSSSTSRAARVYEMASQAEKPSPLEASVPIMWLVSGAFCYAAWSRTVQNTEQQGHVEKLLIV